MSDLLRTDLEAITPPAGRRVGTEGHGRARAYLERRLGELGLVPYHGDRFALTYRNAMARHVEFANLVGTIPGRDPGLAPVLIGAHYDSVISAPCADDNAAAVAIALSAAAALREMPRERDIVIALFDAEEPPYFLGAAMGSIRFCGDHVDARGVHAAVVMDLVGHEFAVPLPGLANLLIATGIESSGALPALIDASPRPDELPLVAAQDYVVGDMSDHHAFRELGVPYLFLTCGRWPHYHQPTDTPDKLAWPKIALIRDYVVTLAGALTERDLSVPAVDTTAMEIRYVEAAFGAALLALTARLGIDALRTRQDLEQLAWGLQAAGL